VEWFATLQKPSTACANFRFSSFMPYFMGPLRCESLTLCERQATIQLHCLDDNGIAAIAIPRPSGN